MASPQDDQEGLATFHVATSPEIHTVASQQLSPQEMVSPQGHFQGLQVLQGHFEGQPNDGSDSLHGIWHPLNSSRSSQTVLSPALSSTSGKCSHLSSTKA